jgi:hypothetical protein
MNMPRMSWKAAAIGESSQGEAGIAFDSAQYSAISSESDIIIFCQIQVYSFKSYCILETANNREPHGWHHRLLSKMSALSQHSSHEKLNN